MNYSSHDLVMDTVRYSIYAIMGPNLMVSNLILLLIILRHKALRQLKEYTIIAGLASIDALAGFGDASAGLYRLHKIFTNQHRNNVSRRHCFLTFHEPVWTVSMPLQGVMLCIVSMDRFMSVWDPLRYLGFTRRYALRMIVVVYCFGAALLLLGTATVWGYTEPEVGSICNFAWGLKHEVSQLAIGIRSVSLLTSVLAYGTVVIVFLYKSNKVGPQQCSSAQKYELKRQRRFTKSMTISCIFTFVLSALPTCAWLYAYVFDFYLYTISTWANILSNLNPAFNLWIFLKRHSELRKGLKAIFHCKSMPDSVKHWNQNALHLAMQQMGVVAAAPNQMVRINAAVYAITPHNNWTAVAP